MNKLVKVDEAAQLLGITKNTLYNWVNQSKDKESSKLPEGSYVKLNGALRFNKEVLSEWIKNS